MPSSSGLPATNGTAQAPNGHSRPETPTGGMALTEYSANPSPPSEEKRARIREVVPEDLLLPNGYPDVSCCGCVFMRGKQRLTGHLDASTCE